MRGPQVIKAYGKRREETAEVLDADGWLRTGDMGVIDERGYVRLVERKKDMILVSGFNVYPSEVEDVALSHPGVSEAAAIGVADERSGERVRLVVVRKSPRLTAEALIAHCRKDLTGYKVPKEVVFRNGPLPKTDIGKILRRAIREQESAPAVGGFAPQEDT